MDNLNEIAKSFGVAVIEDCAQSHGASFNGRKAGSMSDLAAFSFYPTKVLGGFGDGGMIVTNSEEVSHKLRRLRFYGMDNPYYSEEHGYNSRLDELHAEILLRKMSHLDDYIRRRQELALAYDNSLASASVSLPLITPGNNHVFHLYVIRHPERDKIISLLKERGISAGIHYPWPIHMMRGYQHLGYREGDLPVTEKAAKEICSLPMYPSLTNGEQERIIEELKNILKLLQI